MAIGSLLLFSASILFALFLLWYAPGATRRWFRRIMLAKGALLGFFALLTAFYFITSGHPILIFIGFLSLTFAVLQVLLGGGLELIEKLLPKA